MVRLCYMSPCLHDVVHVRVLGVGRPNILQLLYALRVIEEQCVLKVVATYPDPDRTGPTTTASRLNPLTYKITCTLMIAKTEDQPGRDHYGPPM